MRPNDGPLTPTELKKLVEELNKVRFPTQPLLCFPPTFNVNPTVDPGQSVGSQLTSQLGQQNVGVADKQFSQLNLNQQTTIGPGQSVVLQFASQVGQQNVGLSGQLGFPAAARGERGPPSLRG